MVLSYGFLLFVNKLIKEFFKKERERERIREGSRDQTTQGPPDHVGVQFNPKSNGKELKGIKRRQE